MRRYTNWRIQMEHVIESERVLFSCANVEEMYDHTTSIVIQRCSATEAKN